MYLSKIHHLSTEFGTNDYSCSWASNSTSKRLQKATRDTVRQNFLISVSAMLVPWFRSKNFPKQQSYGRREELIEWKVGGTTLTYWERRVDSYANMWPGVMNESRSWTDDLQLYTGVKWLCCFNEYLHGTHKNRGGSGKLSLHQRVGPLWVRGHENVNGTR